MTHLHIHTESIGPGFVKHHLNPVGGNAPWGEELRPVIHVHSAPDKGAPHDHPWDFTTHILRGSYVEEVFSLYTPRTAWGLADQQVWRRELRLHQTGVALQVKAGHIHRIVALPEGECVTCVVMGSPRQDVRWYPDALEAVR